MVELVKRTFEIQAEQDKRLNRLSERMAGVNKSQVLQLILDYALDGFSERVALSGKDAVGLIASGLRGKAMKSKKQPGAKRRQRETKIDALTGELKADFFKKRRS